MAHFHLKHDHDRDWLNDLVTTDAASDTAFRVRHRLGYPDGITFFEEAPAGVLVHEALTVLETECPAFDRAQQNAIDGQPWIDYETTRDAYLTASLVFGRADLLAAVLLDSASPNQSAAWGGFFAAGEVHRTLTPQTLNALIDHVPADVLNVLLGTDLHGDLASVPVWVAMLLASRPQPRRYGTVLRRLALAGATGVREHLVGKHPVLLNRDALNAAIDGAERAVQVAQARSKAKAQREVLHGTTVNGSTVPQVPCTLDSIFTTATVFTDPAEAVTDEGSTVYNPADDGHSSERCIDDLEGGTVGPAPVDPVAAHVDGRLASLGTVAGNPNLSLDQENAERERVGLPPRVTQSKVGERRTAEHHLVVAVENGRMAEVKRLLLAGVDPETPNYIRGLAIVTALKQKGPMAGMLFAHGANASMRTAAGTLLTMVCQAAFDTYSRCVREDWDDERMDAAMDHYVQQVGLLVRAGATASQFNLNMSGTRIDEARGTMAPDAWHWIRQVPMVWEAYDQAVAYRAALGDEAKQFVASIPQIVRDYPVQVKQAEDAVASMLAAAKSRAAGR